MLVHDFRGFSSLSGCSAVLKLDKAKHRREYKIEQRCSDHVVLELDGERKEPVSQYPLSSFCQAPCPKFSTT